MITENLQLLRNLIRFYMPCKWLNHAMVAMVLAFTFPEKTNK